MSDKKVFISEIEKRTAELIGFIHNGLAASPKFDDNESVKFIFMKEQAKVLLQQGCDLAIKAVNL